jgi:hypothetical protein
MTSLVDHLQRQARTGRLYDFPYQFHRRSIPRGMEGTRVVLINYGIERMDRNDRQ